MKSPKRAFKVTRLKLSELVQNTQDRMDVEGVYLEFEAKRQIAVEAHRKAVQAQSAFTIAQAEMQALHQRLLLKVGQFSTEVNSEPIWYVFRRNGEIIFESPYGERTQRNLIRHQLSQLDQSVRSSEDKDDNDLYESDEDDSNSGAASA